MNSLPELVHHDNILQTVTYRPSDLSLLPSSKCNSASELYEPNTAVHYIPSFIMLNHTRSSSQQSSTRSDMPSLSSSPTSSTFESPASIHSSPTFEPVESFKYQTTGASHRLNSLPQFSMANMQGLMRSQPARAQTSRPRASSKRWLTRRTLSQTMMDMERESQASGAEIACLDLFEPRPTETTVSRQSTQNSIVLDGILEVMSGR